MICQNLTFSPSFSKIFYRLLRLCLKINSISLLTTSSCNKNQFITLIGPSTFWRPPKLPSHPTLHVFTLNIKIINVCSHKKSLSPMPPPSSPSSSTLFFPPLSLLPLSLPPVFIIPIMDVFTPAKRFALRDGSVQSVLMNQFVLDVVDTDAGTEGEKWEGGREGGRGR